MKPQATQRRLQSKNRAQQKAYVGLLVIFHHVHQDSRHPAILSKCTASEFLQSLQSSDELKMYAWVGNIFGVHHNNNLKGIFFFKKEKKTTRWVILGRIYQEAFSALGRGCSRCVSAANFCRRSLFSYTDRARFSRLFLTTVSLKGHS